MGEQPLALNVSGRKFPSLGTFVQNAVLFSNSPTAEIDSFEPGN
jgi:hypothetical protein